MNKIDNLNEDEQQLLTEILKELSESGKSDLLNQVNDADYDEIPVDIYTFMTDPNYLGKSLVNDDGELTVYPYWVDFLQKLFNPSAHYIEAALSGAIGLGKSTIATIGLAYILYKLLCLKDPASYYDLVAGSKIGIAILNLDLNQAYGVGYSKLNALLINSPWFLQHGTVSGREYPTYYPDKDIEILVGSKMSHFIGRDIFCLSGDTVISTDQGDRSLYELSESKDKFKVHQYNLDTNKIELSDDTRCMPTMLAEHIYEIELEDGSIIKCTGDHMLLYNGEYVKVKDIYNTEINN